jgi:hypothetical protein
MRLSWNAAPVSSGQKSGWTVPFGVNMKMIRCGREADVPWANDGKAGRNGSAAAESPIWLRKRRRVSVFIGLRWRVIRCRGGR